MSFYLAQIGNKLALVVSPFGKASDRKHRKRKMGPKIIIVALEAAGP